MSERPVGGSYSQGEENLVLHAYEHNWTVQPSRESSKSMPHPSLLAGDFSLLNRLGEAACRQCGF